MRMRNILKKLGKRKQKKFSTKSSNSGAKTRKRVTFLNDEPSLVIKRLSPAQIKAAAKKSKGKNKNNDDDVEIIEILSSRKARQGSRDEKKNVSTEKPTSGRTLRDRSLQVSYTSDLSDEEDNINSPKKNKQAKHSPSNGVSKRRQDDEEDEGSDFSEDESDLSTPDEELDGDVPKSRKSKGSMSGSERCAMDKSEHALRVSVLNKKKIICDLKIEYWRRKIREDFGSK